MRSGNVVAAVVNGNKAFWPSQLTIGTALCAGHVSPRWHKH